VGQASNTAIREPCTPGGVDDGGKVQGEPNESVDPTHLDGRSE